MAEPLGSPIEVRQLAGPNELADIAVGELAPVPGIWEDGAWSTLHEDMPSGRVTFVAAFAGDTALGYGGNRQVDLPRTDEAPGPHTISPATRGALARLIDQVRDERADENIGLTAIEEEPEGAVGAVNLAFLYVRPGARRQGVASEMYEERLRLALAQGQGRPIPAYLTVAHDNSGAIALYTKFGFRPLWNEDGSPFTVRRPHFPDPDAAGRYPGPAVEKDFVMMGRLLVPADFEPAR